jgi:hypothetical protein
MSDKQCAALFAFLSTFSGVVCAIGAFKIFDLLGVI